MKIPRLIFGATDPHSRREPLAALAFAGLCLIFFGPVLLPGRALFGSDFMTYFYPVKQFLRDVVWSEGRIPLWNPHVLSGYPFIGDIQAGIFYPGGFLFYLLSPESAYGPTMALHFFVAGFGMYRFASICGYGGRAAWAAGAIYAFNGFAVRHVFAGHLTLFLTAAWAPWIWWSYIRSLGLRGTQGWSLTAGLVAMLILGGFPQVAFYAILFLFALALALPCPGVVVPASRRLAAAVIPVSAGFLLSAVQLLPTLELTRWSTRADGIVADAALRDSWRWFDLLNLFFANFFGSVTNGTYWGHVESNFYWESGAYIGVPAIAALLIFGWRRAEPIERFCFIALAAAIFLAFGRHNPVFRMMHSLPGIRNFRVPVQILYIAVSAAAIQAAALVQRIERNDPLPWARLIGGAVVLLGSACAWQAFFLDPAAFPASTLRHAAGEIQSALAGFTVFFAVAVALIIAASRGVLRGATAASLVCALLVADLYIAGHELVRPARTYPLINEAANGIRFAVPESGGAQYRVSATGPYVFGNSTILSRQIGIRGYNPLMLAHYARFILSAAGGDPGREDYLTDIPQLSPVHMPVLRLLSLKYAVDAQFGQIETAPNAMPRAFWIRNARVADEDQALKAICSPGFNPETQLIVSGISQPPASSTALDPAYSEESCRWIESHREKLRLEVDAPAPDGYVVFSEIFYPGWTATIDGSSVKIVRANYLFRAVPVPAGRHVIEMRYSPVSLQAGAALSVIGALICVIGFGRPLRRKETVSTRPDMV